MKNLLLFTAFLLFQYTSHGQYSISTEITDNNCADATLTISTNASGPFTYGVYGTFFQYNESSASNTLSIPHVPPGVYFVRVASSSWNVMENSVTIPAAFQADIDAFPATCNDNASITATPTGGTAPYTYLWTNGSTEATATGLRPAVYAVSITDHNGCVFKSDSIYAGANYGFSIYTTSTLETCETKGTATVNTSNSADTYSYYWKTTPVQTTASATGLNQGSYEVVVTNSGGCSLTTSAYVGRQSGIKLTLTGTQETCLRQNATLTVTAQNGTAPYTYLWNTGENTASIANLSAHTLYSVQVTDATGCSETIDTYLSRTSPVTVSFNHTPAACMDKGGSVTATGVNGTAPYTFTWGNGSNNETLNDLRSGYYSVLVQDAEGCSATSYHFIPQTGCAILEGTVHNDINNNCMADNGESGNRYAWIQNGASYTYTNTSGHYSMEAAPGTSNLKVYPSENWTFDCGQQTLVVNAPTAGTYDNNNFYLKPTDEASDVQIQVFGRGQRPGFTSPVTLYAYNAGSRIESGTLTYTFSENWNFESADPMPFAYDAASRTASWTYNHLNPEDSKIITVSMSVPTSVSLGTLLNAEAIISNDNDEEDLANNHYLLETITTNSFDPNDIQVAPQGVGSEGFITEEQTELTYLIRFQNTGTDVAYNVFVKSPVDADVEEQSISILEASHPFTASIEEDSLRFNFIDINLPDSLHNEKESHGFILFKLNRKAGLPELTEIVNSANIYFDYNAPVATNQVKNTVMAITGNAENQTSETLMLYPNPARDKVRLSVPSNTSAAMDVQILSGNGQVIALQKLSLENGQGIAELELTPLHLSPGLYIVRAIVDDKTHVQKLIVMP